MSRHRAQRGCRPPSRRVIVVIELDPDQPVQVLAARALMSVFDDLQAEGIEADRITVEIEGYVFLP